jgi:hypothetical protein
VRKRDSVRRVLLVAATERELMALEGAEPARVVSVLRS